MAELIHSDVTTGRLADSQKDRWTCNLLCQHVDGHLLRSWLHGLNGWLEQNLVGGEWREREGERQRQRETETERQRDSETETDRQTELVQ